MEDQEHIDHIVDVVGSRTINVDGAIRLSEKIADLEQIFFSMLLDVAEKDPAQFLQRIYPQKKLKADADPVRLREIVKKCVEFLSRDNQEQLLEKQRMDFCRGRIYGVLADITIRVSEVKEIEKVPKVQSVLNDLAEEGPAILRAVQEQLIDVAVDDTLLPMHLSTLGNPPPAQQRHSELCDRVADAAEKAFL